MANRFKKESAIKLREQGKTYKQIHDLLNISKSTLSGWLKNYPLNEKQLNKLLENIVLRKQIAREKTTITKFKKRKERLELVFQQEKSIYSKLSIREFYIAGLMLYWGEGVKGEGSAISLNNTDPRVLIFFKNWLIKCVDVSENEIRVILHLYNDMNIKDAINYWSKVLKIPKKQFIKPYVKDSNRFNIRHNGYGKGTCGLYIYDKRKKEKILAGIDVIGEIFM